MALTKNGEFLYGTTSGNTQAELGSYSVANGQSGVSVYDGTHDLCWY